jgi:hypothetical protein
MKQADRTLIGPVVEAENEGGYSFVVICGETAQHRARVDQVRCAHPLLLECMRTSLLIGLDQSEFALTATAHEAESELLTEAAKVWPEQFARIAAEFEVAESGGSRA